MTPTLTDADREALDRIQIAWTDSPASSDGTNGMRVLLESIVLHFIAREREACATLCDEMVLYTGFDCAAAIRARQDGL